MAKGGGRSPARGAEVAAPATANWFGFVINTTEAEAGLVILCQAVGGTGCSMDIAPGPGEEPWRRCHGGEETPPAAGDGETGEMPESGAG